MVKRSGDLVVTTSQRSTTDQPRIELVKDLVPNDTLWFPLLSEEHGPPIRPASTNLPKVKSRCIHNGVVEDISVL